MTQRQGADYPFFSPMLSAVNLPDGSRATELLQTPDQHRTKQRPEFGQSATPKKVSP